LIDSFSVNSSFTGILENIDNPRICVIS